MNTKLTWIPDDHDGSLLAEIPDPHGGLDLRADIWWNHSKDQWRGMIRRMDAADLRDCSVIGAGWNEDQDRLVEMIEQQLDELFTTTPEQS